MEIAEIISVLRSLQPAFEAGGVRHVEIFGSRARGDAKANSDLDLLIEVSSQSRFSILDLIGVEHAVQDATGLSANAFMKRSLDQDFLNSISSDTIRIF